MSEVDAPFVFKLIRLRARVRTSLQLHREKEEANLLLEGRAELVFGAGSMQEVLCSAAKAVPADRPFVRSFRLKSAP